MSGLLLVSDWVHVSLPELGLARNRGGSTTGAGMTGVELVLAALAAGATAGVTDTASSAVRDTYSALREAVRRRLAAQSENGARALEASEVEPGVWQATDGLGELLSASGVDRDTEILAAAQMLLTQLSTDDVRTRSQVIDAREARGLQVGDHNTQTNTFS